MIEVKPFVPFTLLTFVFVGCAAIDCPPRTVEYINTPVYCNVELPEKPVLQEGVSHLLDNFSKVLIYKDQLEMSLYCCKGDKRCITKK